MTVTANVSRGGVVASPDGNLVTPTFAGAYVGTLQISIARVNGRIQILFAGGELETALRLDASSWSGTGNTSGTYSETPGPDKAKFFRVHRH